MHINDGSLLHTIASFTTMAGFVVFVLGCLVGVAG